MFRNNVYTFKNLPVEEKQRMCTDCCCTIISSLFALTLFIFSFIMFRRNNFYEVNFPTDDKGKTCAYDYPDHPYAFFENVDDLSSGRHCISDCPDKGQFLNCPTAECQAIYSTYETQPQVNRLGAFCQPVDESLQSTLWSQSQLHNKMSLLHSYDVIGITLGIAACIGLLYLVLMVCLPRQMTYIVFILAGLLLIAAGIIGLVKNIKIFEPHFWNIIICSLVILGGVILLLLMLFYSREIKLVSIFMHYANQALKASPGVFLYIPFFIILTILLLVLIMWQYIAFGTFNNPYLEDGEVYKTSGQNIALQVLNIIELIWGLQFLRDAFNFNVSGNAVEWYFKNQNNIYDAHCTHPFNRCMCRNWGSIAGGSFLNAFFTLPDLLSDLFRCESKGKCGKCASCYRTCCCCDYIFQLVRTDAYSYINLSGIPYCNAARQCQAMCRYSDLFNGSQSVIRLYRISAHICLVTLIFIISYFILESKARVQNGWIIALIIAAAYIGVTYFICIHADAAEGLMICYLAEQNCEGEQQMTTCPPQLRNQIYMFRVKDEQ